MNPTEKNNSYPVFEPNQVLSASHLNNTFNYLDEQERLTRANLIGIGIVCGLKISYDPAATAIHISRGYGITSEGYLILEPGDVSLVSYRTYELPGEPDYPSFKDSSSPPVQYPLWELFPEGEPDTTPLGTPPDFLNDKSVLLFLELKKEGLRNCSPNNCDDRGSEIKTTVRRLLVKKEDLTNISDPPLVDFQKLSVGVPEIPMRRINFSTPEDLHNYQDVFKKYFAYQVNGKTLVERLSEEIDNTYKIIKLLIPDLINFEKAKLKLLFTFPDNTSVMEIQYYFDLLRDLTSAYHELRAALLQQVAICLPDSSHFPRHLILGMPGSSMTAEWRTGYFPSPAVASPECRLSELRFLFGRLNQIVLNFNVQSGATVAMKITPGLYGFKHLSGKSLPFYYKPEIREHWDAGRKRERAREVLSWHDDGGSADHVRNPLQYDLEPYNFFRVEGLIGKNIIDVIENLDKLLKTNRLPFSILYVNADKIGNFLEKHFAIEHEAGVVRGGTFVVVYSGIGPYANSVLCDFALPYRIDRTESSGCLCRVAVKECLYEWFDSKRHLSSLARLKYPLKISREFDRELLAKFYVIRIYSYKIQDAIIVDGNGEPVLVNIPIDELISGQISAITRRLNEKFPNGLVFDYDTSTNKLVIRYFADQTFRIEWGGLQGNQIRYAYTPEGIYRWQKGAWESLSNVYKYKVMCRLRNEYRPDEYRCLQEDDYFSAGYPTPVQMPTAKELIEWERITRMRAGKYNSMGKLPIKDLLRSILDYIFKKDSNAKIVLVGSWANGSWVSHDSRQNAESWTNMKMRWTDFMALREVVTGKTGYSSDIELLVESEKVNEISAEEINKKLVEETVKPYKVNIFTGKKDAQKGIILPD